MTDPYESCARCWPRPCGPEPYRILCKRREVTVTCTCPGGGLSSACPDPIHVRALRLVFEDELDLTVAQALTQAREEKDSQGFERPPSGNDANMDIDQERDFAEEAANAELLRDPDPEPDFTTGLLAGYSQRDQKQVEDFTAAIGAQALSPSPENAVLSRLSRLSDPALTAMLARLSQDELDAIRQMDFTAVANAIEDAALDEAERRAGARPLFARPGRTQ